MKKAEDDSLPRVEFFNGKIWIYISIGKKITISKKKALNLADQLIKATMQKKQEKSSPPKKAKRKKKKRSAYMLTGRNSIYVIAQPPPKHKPQISPSSKGKKTILRRKEHTDQNIFNPVITKSDLRKKS